MQQILAGKTLGAGFKVGSDAFNLGGATNREDLLLQCQLLTAYLTDPGYRPEAMRQAIKGIEQLYNGLEHAINAPLQTEVSRLLASGDSRFGLPPKAVLTGRTIDEVKTWLAPQLARGALEIAVAGDLDLESTIDIVARTFGTLREREPKPALTAERHVTFPAEPLTKDYSVETKIPKGLVVLYWPTTDSFDVRRTRRLSLLAQVFSDRLRLKVREAMGGAYSPSAGIASSDTYPDYGFFVANLTVEPAQAAKIADAVKAIAADILAKGITDDELARAKQPVLTSLRESARTNSYWVNSVLSKAQEKPEVLDWSRTRLADNEAITKEELVVLAKQYLSPERASRIIILPRLCESLVMSLARSVASCPPITSLRPVRSPRQCWATTTDRQKDLRHAAAWRSLWLNYDCCRRPAVGMIAVSAAWAIPGKSLRLTVGHSPPRHCHS